MTPAIKKNINRKKSMNKYIRITFIYNTSKGDKKKETPVTYPFSYWCKCTCFESSWNLAQNDRQLSQLLLQKTLSALLPPDLLVRLWNNAIPIKQWKYFNKQYYNKLSFKHWIQQRIWIIAQQWHVRLVWTINF